MLGSRLNIIGWLLFSIAPFLLCIIPWYGALDFDGAIEETRGGTGSRTLMA
jgi:hypothetical protein